MRDNSGKEIFGEVKNEQSREMHSIRVIVALYDVTGKIVDTILGFPASTTLSAGQTSPYRINTLDNKLAFNHYEVFAQGELIDETAPPTALVNVRVRSERSYDLSTSRYVVGEIVNDAAQPAYGVLVAARFYDAADHLVAVTDAGAYLSQTQPNQRNPFKISVTNTPSTTVRYELELFGSTTSLLTYRPITVVSQQIRDNFGVEVLGEVRSDQAQEVRGVRVVVVFYDNADNVVNTAFGLPDSSTLATGQTSTYKISTFDNNLTFTSFSVQSEGYLAP